MCTVVVRVDIEVDVRALRSGMRQGKRNPKKLAHFHAREVDLWQRILPTAAPDSGENDRPRYADEANEAAGS